jgi:hypothetical protein
MARRSVTARDMGSEILGLRNPVITKGHPSGSGLDTSSLTLVNDWLTPTYNVWSKEMER